MLAKLCFKNIYNKLDFFDCESEVTSKGMILDEVSANWSIGL